MRSFLEICLDVAKYPASLKSKLISPIKYDGDDIDHTIDTYKRLTGITPLIEEKE